MIRSAHVDVSPRIGFVIIALLALTVHGAFLAILPTAYQVNESSDFHEFYRPVAVNVLDGKGLIDAHGQPAVRYPPGFPVLVAAALAASNARGAVDSASEATSPEATSSETTLSETTWLSAINALCFALVAGLLWLIAHRQLGARAAWMASVGWMLYPPILWLTKQPNSELPFLVVLLAALALWLRVLDDRSSVLALLVGVLVGVATLVRPVSLLLPAVLALSVWLPWRGSVRAPNVRWLMAAAVLVGHLAVLAPWEMWAHHKTGVWIPVSSGGRLSLLDGLTLGADVGEPAPAMPASVLALSLDIEAHRSEIRGPLDAAAFLADRASEQPLAVLGLGAVKAARSWYGTESTRFEGALLALQLPLLILAVVGLVRLGRVQPGAAGLIVLIVFYFWGMSILVLSIVRYMVPAMALLTLPVAFAASQLMDHLLIQPGASPT